MRKTFFSRIVAVSLAVFMLVGSAFAVAAATPGEHVDTTADYVRETLEILGDIKWAAYKEKYKSASFYDGDPITITAADGYEFTVPASVDTDESALGIEVLSEYGGKQHVLQTPEYGSVTWKVNVPADGLYAIDIEYYPIVSKATTIERTLRINGEVPFSQVRNLLFSRYWTDEYKYDDDGKVVFEEDGNSNERRPSKVEAPKWITYAVSDPTGYYNGEFYFYLTAGENTLTLEAQKEPMLVSSVTLRPRKNHITYEQYLADCTAKGYGPAPAGTEIYIEAEHYTATSDSTLYAISDSTSSITSPQHPCYQRLNAIGSSNWSTIGQWYEWTVDVPESGMYTINPRYLQNAVAGIFVSRRLRIDGEVPFEEANNLEFLYDTKWQASPLSDGTTEFQFYLEKGKHTFSLEVTLGNFGQVYAEVQDCLTQINEIYLKILQITGTSPDSYMDYGFYNRMAPEIKAMKTLADRLTEIADLFVQISGGTSSNSATLINVAQILYKMNKDSEGQIAKNFTALKSNIGSLGTWLNNMMKQALTIDYFEIQPADEGLRKANGNFFQEAWFEIKAFIYSFIYDGYSFASETDEGEIIQIEVWTTVSREYAQIIRELVDESFSKAYPNISVNLKLVAAGTLLPATLAGVGPDVMMGAGQSEVIDYAVRTALVDLAQYKDYGLDELTSRFNDAAMTPLTVALGSPEGDIAIYGIPQTQSFNVMFYRKDILAELGITIPETWDDFKAVLPKLLSKNYMIGVGTSADCTSTYYMFIYQNGGSLFTDGGTKISFNTDTSLAAFDQLCKFYTQYRFPIKYDSANRFRTGEMPILIADYISFYNQFTIFATELKGLWGFSLVPGVARADGSVNRSTYSSVTAMIMMDKGIERDTQKTGQDVGLASFRFMEWWMRTEVQSQYANELIALLGPAGKYNTANVEAFNAMSWTASELKSLKNVTQNLFCVNEMPGSYIISRYVTFAFTEVYNNHANPAEEILQYVNTINSEMDRKREELSRQFYIPARKDA